MSEMIDESMSVTELREELVKSRADNTRLEAYKLEAEKKWLEMDFTIREALKQIHNRDEVVKACEVALGSVTDKEPLVDKALTLIHTLKSYNKPKQQDAATAIAYNLYPSSARPVNTSSDKPI